MLQDQVVEHMELVVIYHLLVLFLLLVVLPVVVGTTKLEKMVVQEVDQLVNLVRLLVVVEIRLLLILLKVMMVDLLVPLEWVAVAALEKMVIQMDKVMVEMV